MESIITSEHFIHPYFAEPTHPITITLIGVGGTGSLLLTKLARLNAVLLEINHPGIFVTAYDNDVFEKHNVGRQQCTFADVGKNKAICSIQKINFAFGLGWRAFDQKINSKTLKEKFNPQNIIITCVDNADFRNKLNTYFKKCLSQYKFNNDYRKPFYWLDCGNGKNFGQVVLGTILPQTQPKTKNFKTIDSLPTVVDMYGNLNKFDTEEIQQTKSCSILDKLKEQDIFVNDMASVYAVNIIKRLFFQVKINTQGVIFNQDTSMPIKIN